MARQTVAQPAKEIHMSMCRGVGKRFEDIFDREKQPGQPRALVQQKEFRRVSEEAIPEDPLPVNTTPRHASGPTLGHECTDQLVV